MYKPKTFKPRMVAKLRTTYPANWSTLRLTVLERDNYTCRKCNSNLRGVFHRHIHHIIPLSRGGNNSLSNLISLCQACHERVHKH